MPKPPLSKAYLCGREATLDLHSPGWFVRHDVELIRGITVDHIDLAHQEVVTEGGCHYPYWHLVLSCGANAVPLRIPGAEAALPCAPSPTPSSCGWPLERRTPPS